MFHFEEETAKKKKIGSILDRMDEKRFAGVHKRRFNPDPIIRVRCTRPKKDKILTLPITQNGHLQKYTEVIFASELPKYGLSKWMQI